MAQSTASLSIELTLEQLKNLEPFLDKAQPVFNMKIFCQNKASFDVLHEVMRKNKIKINSIETNFLKNNSSKEKNSSILDPNLSVGEELISNLEKELVQDSNNDESEEHKSLFEAKKEVIEKVIENIDSTKLFYIEQKKKHEDILSDFFDEDENFKVIFHPPNSLKIVGSKKDVLKAERTMKKLINELQYELFENKKFKNFQFIQQFLEQDFVKDILEEFGIKTLEYEHQKLTNEWKKNFKGDGLYFFVESKDRKDDLLNAKEKISNHKEHSINITQILKENLSTDEKQIYKKLIKLKYNYISGKMVDLFKEKAQHYEIIFKEIINENDKVKVIVEGDSENKGYYENDLKLILSNLRTITKTNQIRFKKNFYHSEIVNNLESFEKLILNKENFAFPLELYKKYEDESEEAIVSIIGYIGNENLEKFKKLGILLQETLNYIQKEIKIENHYLEKKLRKPDYLKTLQEDFHVKLSLKAKILIVIGNYEKIKQLEEHLKYQENELKREKIIYRFETLLNFMLFYKYELPNYYNKILKDEITMKKVTNSMEFLIHSDKKISIMNEIEESEKNIKKSISFKFVQIIGKNKYKTITNPEFQKRLVNYQENNIKDCLAIEILTNQASIETLKKNLESQNKPSTKNYSTYTFADKIEINLYDSIFPEDISIDALVINIDVKGNYIDSHSQRIAEASETNRIVSKEINKLNDNNLNKKKRAEVTSLVECRNPSRSFKITKMFYSIIKTPNIKEQDVFSMAIDYRTKKIYNDYEKFTYQKNLKSIFRTALDDKFTSIGFIVPRGDIDNLIKNLEEFYVDNVDFTILNKISIFTNTNEENTYLNNLLLHKFKKLEEKDIDASKQEYLNRVRNSKKNKWNFFKNNLLTSFSENENQKINEAYLKKMSEIWILRQSKQMGNNKEIFLNLKDRKATNISEYKPIDYKSVIRSNKYLQSIVDNYLQLGIHSLTYYEENWAFYHLNFEKMAVELFELDQMTEFPLINEEIIEEGTPDFEEVKNDEEGEKFYYAISGYTDDIEMAISKINEEFEKEKIKDEYVFPKNLEIEDIKKIIKSIEGKFELESSLVGTTLVMKGAKNDISEAKSIMIIEMTKIIDEIAEKISNVQYPKEWQPQKEFFEKFQLNELSKEYDDISRRFKETLKTQKILRIKRLQNKNIYMQYYHAKVQMKNTKNIINEMLLFHGSRSTNPKKIYSGKDVGFDMRLANEGLWGTAIYFAEKAVY